MTTLHIPHLSRQRELIKTDIVVATVLAGATIYDPQLLNKFAFGHPIVQTDLHVFISAFTCMVIFNTACALSCLLPSTSPLVPVMLGLSHALLALRSVLLYQYNGMTTGFLIFSSYNITMTLLYFITMFGDPFYLGFEEPEVQSKKTEVYYNYQTSILCADILPQLLFGAFVFYNEDILCHLLPYPIVNGLPPQESLMVSNACLLMILNAVVQFSALLNFDYTYAQGSAAMHMVSAITSIWLMNQLDAYNTSTMWTWTAIHLFFAAFMYTTSLQLANRATAAQIKYGTWKPNLLRKPLKQDDKLRIYSPA